MEWTSIPNPILHDRSDFTELCDIPSPLSLFPGWRVLWIPGKYLKAVLKCFGEGLSSPGKCWAFESLLTDTTCTGLVQLWQSWQKVLCKWLWKTRILQTVLDSAGNLLDRNCNAKYSFVDLIVASFWLHHIQGSGAPCWKGFSLPAKQGWAVETPSVSDPASHCTLNLSWTDCWHMATVHLLWSLWQSRATTSHSGWCYIVLGQEGSPWFRLLLQGTLLAAFLEREGSVPLSGVGRLKPGVIFDHLLQHMDIKKLGLRGMYLKRN